MSKVSVFEQGWIDLVFEGRNKNYGAYQLRQQDSKTTMLAFFSGISIMALLVGIPTIANYLKPDHIEPLVITSPITPVNLPEVFKTPETPKPEPKTSTPAGATASSQPTVAFTPLVATSTPTPTDIPDINTVLNTNAGSTTSAGDPGGTITGTAPTSTIPGTGTGFTPTGGEGTIETFVDVAPQFPGGLQEFYKKVSDKFRTPEVDVARTLKVYVSFVVETDGSLTSIKTTRDPGFGMGAEAVRVLKSIKIKWSPGMKGGKPVRTAYNLPITVNVH